MARTPSKPAKSPEEAKEKLGHLVDKMDSNSDGQVDEKELTMWIHYVQTKYIYDDTERQWEENDKDRGTTLFLIITFFREIFPTENIHTFCSLKPDLYIGVFKLVSFQPEN